GRAAHAAAGQGPRVRRRRGGGAGRDRPGRAGRSPGPVRVAHPGDPPPGDRARRRAPRCPRLTLDSADRPAQAGGMVRGRARRWNGWVIAVMAVLLVGTGGPSLALSDLDLHVGLGIGLAVVTAGHLWLHRTRALAWLPGRRSRRGRWSRRRRLVRGQ